MSVKSKLTKLAIFGAVAGGVAAAVKRFKGGDADNWQSSYDPPPAPPAPAPTPVEDPAPESSGDVPPAKPHGDPLTDPLPPEDK